MTQAIRIDRFGGPEVLSYRPVTVGEPGEGEARIRHTAIGVNMVDTYYRTGLYPLSLPSGLGGEGAGVVVSVGPGVAGLEPGDRVAYTRPMQPFDGYSLERVMEARWLVRLPAEIDERQGAAMMLKGLTSWYLLTRSYAVNAGDWILLYAAAGGVGSIASQWAASLGARVIGVVGSEAKRQQALAHGCEAVLLATDDIVARVRKLTGGRGLPVVYDSVGRATFMQSLDCLRPHGVMVSFGNASGPVQPVAPLELSKRGSLYLTRPTLIDFIREREDLEAGCAALFERVLSAKIRIEIGQDYPLARAADAHRDLEGRRTVGSSVLLP
ncbi:MAG TPA: quinone oxidoreductase [Gammaproteobacteria bacterium]|nr:quinone oxidoreductase [Gammaproteobacteria bacterium]